jgi:superoxide dismutase, Cu-Zn family
MKIAILPIALMSLAVLPSIALTDSHKAVAHLNPASGSGVSGTVTFTESGKGVEVALDAKGLKGEHGFHVHEFGDCSAPDASTAGSHFNPTGHKHGGPDAEVRHTGDLGNIKAGANGTAKKSFVDSQISLKGEHSVVGRALVIHAKADDLKTDPSGNSGDRIACGVIGYAK